jgi:multiple sugar transport system substrate-binding protein
MKTRGLSRRGAPYHLGRRRFLQLAGLTGGAAVLAACGPAGATATAVPTEGGGVQPTAAANPVTISWWNQYYTDIVKATVPEVIAGFNAEYPHITVDYELSGGPPGGGDFIEVLLARIAANNAPDAITLFNAPVEFAQRGALLALDDMLVNARWAKPGAFYDNVLKSTQWQGKTYGLPASAGAATIVINTQKFEEKGISTNREDFPKTWDELKRLSAEFVEFDGDTLMQAGIVPWGYGGFTLPAWAECNGGKFFDAENAKYVLDSENNIEWWSTWVEWLDEQYGGDIERLNQFGNFAEVGAGTAFQLGLISMGQTGSWGTTNADAPTWEVVKYPVGPSGTTSRTTFWPNWFSIPAGSPNPDAAFQFIEYFSTEGWEIWYRKILDTPSWREFDTSINNETLEAKLGAEKAKDVNQYFAEYLEDAAEIWTSPIEGFASDTVAAALDEVMHKNKTPAEALAEAQQLCQTRLDDVLAGRA